MSELKEIKPEYVYATIPAEYVCVYNKLIVMLADFGEQMLKDCKATCTERNTNIIDCYNMFNAAVAAYQLGKYKLADTLIKYIKAKINVLYRQSDYTEFNTLVPFPISEDGRLRALVGCDDSVRFYVDLETGELYEQYIEEKKTNGVFVIEDEELNYNN